MVLLSQKQHDPDIFDTQILLHRTLCKKSRAVKLHDTSEDLQLALACEIREDEIVGEHILDMAEASSTKEDGTLYIQCLDIQKQLVTNYIQDFLKVYAKKHPDDSHASIVLTTPTRNNSSSVSSNMVNTWNKFQSVFGSASTGTYLGNTHPTIPVNIDTQQMYSCASVVSGNCGHIHQQSALQQYLEQH